MPPGTLGLILLMDILMGCIERDLNPNIGLPLMAAEAHEAIVTVQGGGRT